MFFIQFPKLTVFSQRKCSNASIFTKNRRFSVFFSGGITYSLHKFNGKKVKFHTDIRKRQVKILLIAIFFVIIALNNQAVVIPLHSRCAKVPAREASLFLRIVKGSTQLKRGRFNAIHLCGLRFFRFYNFLLLDIIH